MAAAGPTLPCPPLTIALDLPGEGAIDQTHLKALPAKAGILAIEDEGGGTLALLSTPNLRRAALTRLGPLPPDQHRSRRVDLRGIARRLRATTVGSVFEADWAYLQLARARLPHSYRALLDRWQAWFIHCNPSQRFPQWIKTSRPGAPPTGYEGTYVGPFGDKHAAHRFIEMLEDAFDLCRYHHILIQAPHGSACAYKEMGRCPAPCDGSVDLQHYYGQIAESASFARTPAKYRSDQEAQMQRCSVALDFEGAQQRKKLLDRTQTASRREFVHVRDLREFRFIVVLPAQHKDWARIMLVDGGWIEPAIDVSADTAEADVRDFVGGFAHVQPKESSLSEHDVENIGVVCRHLLAPQSQAKRRRAEFLHLPEALDDPTTLSNAIKRTARGTSEDDPQVPSEQELEGV